MFYWFKMFTEWRQIKIVEPRPLKKDIMKKNESIDNLIKYICFIGFTCFTNGVKFRSKNQN